MRVGPRAIISVAYRSMQDQRSFSSSFRSAAEPGRASRVPWRAMPADHPAWDCVYTFFKRWRDKGLAGEFHDRLRDWVRETVRRDPEPTAGSVWDGFRGSRQRPGAEGKPLPRPGRRRCSNPGRSMRPARSGQRLHRMVREGRVTDLVENDNNWPELAAEFAGQSSCP
ncbi:hypothetical protein C5746_41945 [Streptomyces atratus]|uniref:Transposase of IS4/5 family n=1 Tax=Streptomyces atratus TaxID=1893 RepID=A0A2Z5JPL3_STRAR|nr:hypothetical protein C5746_41945 [Streptomyces atratus]